MLGLLEMKFELLQMKRIIKSDAIYQNLLTVFSFCYGLFHFDDGDMLKIEN